MLKRTVGTVCASVVAIASGCGVYGGDPGRTTDGPLALSSDTTLFFVQVPTGDDGPKPDELGRWWITFGGFVLCTDDPRRAPVIDEVRFDVEPQPEELNGMFRIAPEKRYWKKTDKFGEEIDWTPMLALMGRPADRFNGVQTLGGSYVKIPDSPVDYDCSASFEEGYIELIVELRAGDAGAWIDKTYIDYHIDDDLYTLEVDADLVACGRVVADMALERGESCDE